MILPDRVERLNADKDMTFIVGQYQGDLRLAADSILHLGEHETAAILNMLHSEYRMLYAIFIVQLVVIFYCVLFRRTVRTPL